MRWSFQLLQQFSRVFISQARPHPHLARAHHEGLGRRNGASVQAAAQELVNRFLEGLTGTPHFGAELLADVRVESQSRPHIMMLTY